MENVFLDRAAPRFESPVPVRLPDQRVVELTVEVEFFDSVPPAWVPDPPLHRLDAQAAAQAKTLNVGDPDAGLEMVTL